MNPPPGFISGQYIFDSRLDRGAPPRTPSVPAATRNRAAPPIITEENSGRATNSQSGLVPINRRGQTLTEHEVLILFNCALDLRRDYNDGKKGFWRKVEHKFVRKVKDSYGWNSCKGRIAKYVRDRKTYLSSLANDTASIITNISGVNENCSPLQRAVDKWIHFLEKYTAKRAGQMEKKKQKEREDRRALDYRDGMVEALERQMRRRAQQAGEQVQIEDDDVDSEEREERENRADLVKTMIRQSQRRAREFGGVDEGDDVDSEDRDTEYYDGLVEAQMQKSEQHGQQFCEQMEAENNNDSTFPSSSTTREGQAEDLGFDEQMQEDDDSIPPSSPSSSSSSSSASSVASEEGDINSTTLDLLAKLVKIRQDSIMLRQALEEERSANTKALSAQVAQLGTSLETTFTKVEQTMNLLLECLPEIIQRP